MMRLELSSGLNTNMKSHDQGIGFGSGGPDLKCLPVGLDQFLILDYNCSLNNSLGLVWNVADLYMVGKHLIRAIRRAYNRGKIKGAAPAIRHSINSLFLVFKQ